MLFDKKPVPDYLKYFAAHVDEVGPDSKCVKSYWVYRGHSVKRIDVEVFGGVLQNICFWKFRKVYGEIPVW